MPSLTTIVHWLDAPALSIALVLATATGLLRAAYALAARILAPYPRARAFVEAVAAMAPDVLRFVQQVYRVLTGRDLPSTQPVSVVPSAPGVALPAEKQGALDVSATRPEPPHPTPPDGVAFDAQRRTLGAVTFDPRERQSIVAPPPVDRDDGQRGSVDLPGLLTCIVGLILAGALFYGCPRNPPVSGCQPEAQTCIRDRPHVCSASQRWHVAGDRSCASIGGQCTVLGGRAYCGPVADAGAADASEGGAL